MSRFTFLFHAPGGHSFWQDTKTSLIAVSDDSGPTPDKTDDGTLYLDTERPVQASGTGFYLPLILPGGKKATTIASPPEARLVCTTFKMRMSVDGVSFALVS